MDSTSWQLLHIVAATALLSIGIYVPVVAATTTTAKPYSFSSVTKAALANSMWHSPQQQQQQPYQQHWQHNFGFDSSNQPANVEAVTSAAAAATKKSSTRRSYGGSEGSLAATALNGLTNLAGSPPISSGYGEAGATAMDALASTKQQIPVYEEQPESDYAAAAGVSVYTGANNQHSGLAGSISGNGGGRVESPSSHTLSSAIYNLHAAGTHNGGFLPLVNSYGKYVGNAIPHAGASYPLTPPPAHSTSVSVSSSGSKAPTSTAYGGEVQQQSLDKISVGNFLHHYDHNSGYDELSYAPHATPQHYQPQQQQQQQQQPAFFPSSALSAHSAAAFTPPEAQVHNSYAPQQHEAFSSSDASYDEPASNYLPHDVGAPSVIPQQLPPDVINYVPYPVVKKLHVPVREPVKIPVSHTIIVPVSKPLPIHIPVTQQVQVPIEKELKIPLERVVPFPVEKGVPVPVEKRVPYPVVKYVPVKIPQPFPVKVPVFKTILHKVKSLW